MRSIRLNYAGTVATACAGIIIALAAVAIAEEQQETSLLFNPPIRSANDLPALPPPIDPDAAAPRDDRPTLPAPTKARPTSADRPFLRPVESEPIGRESVAADAPTTINTLPAPPAAGPLVHQVADIKYDTDRGARKMYAASQGVIETVMITPNPADGCFYEIPICLPACCVDEPAVESRRGLLGRGVVEYCWPCGFEVEVIFRLRGDVKVEYDA